MGKVFGMFDGGTAMRQTLSDGVTISATPYPSVADVPGAPLIALLVSPGSWGNRQLLQGISDYAREHTRWRFALQEFTADGTVDKWVLRAKPAGAIAEITSPRMVNTLRRAGIPVVDVLEEHPVAHVPQIVGDDQKIMRLAIDHLLAKGLRHLAFVGDRDRHFATRRQVWFAEYVRIRHQQIPGHGKASFAMEMAMLPGATLLSSGLSGLAEWLNALPKPVGVVACNDAWASQVLRACSEHGIRVPDDVAVIGVDDDPVFCQICDPPLTSIDCRSHAMGYTAAEMLDRMINRQESPPPITFVDPGGVRSRGSTDVLAIDDDQVVAAVRLLREYACAGLAPVGAAARLGVSVRTLERMFAKHVGHSPAMEISRIRLDRARELLATTELPLIEISRRAAFSHADSLHRMFKKRFGVSPSDYRRATQSSPVAGNAKTGQRGGQLERVRKGAARRRGGR